MNKIIFYFFYLILFFCERPMAQTLEEVPPLDFIKTIDFRGPNEGDLFPILKTGQQLRLTFDDITQDEVDYYYKIVHCNYDWTPSNLLKPQYLKGTDNRRIIDYNNSYGTLVGFSHYRLALPNEYTAFKLSGNYMLQIFDYEGELMFSRKFIVIHQLLSVDVRIKRSRNLKFINEKQVVQFTIRPLNENIRLTNLPQEARVVVLKNYRWDEAKYNLKPQFTVANELIYRYDTESAFYGGNEYLNFDNKELRAPGGGVSKVVLDDIYNHYLFTNTTRTFGPYTYYPDINGDFRIQTNQGTDAPTEAEYCDVHFSLKYEPDIIGLNKVYVVGKFNNYHLSSENLMTFNSETGNMELRLLLKQGFYNYHYHLVGDKQKLPPNAVSGNFSQTENTYMVLVYYKDFGGNHDRLIGLGVSNSSNITQ